MNFEGHVFDYHSNNYNAKEKCSGPKNNRPWLDAEDYFSFFYLILGGVGAALSLCGALG